MLQSAHNPLSWQQMQNILNKKFKENKFNEFVEFLKDYLKDKSFDQCIIEKSSKSKWIHLGLKNLKGLQRKQIFNLYV